MKSTSFVLSLFTRHIYECIIPEIMSIIELVLSQSIAIVRKCQSSFAIIFGQHSEACT